MKIKGSLYGIISGFMWALDTVLIGIVLSRSVFVSSEYVILIAPLISTFLHDLLSSVWVALYLLFRGELKDALASIKTKSGKFVLLGGLLGGPVGMTSYILAIKYLGSSYAAPFSAIYPAVGALFAFILLRDRLAPRNWLGLITSIFFIFLLGYTGEGEIASGNYWLGILFILLCISGWGMESTIVAYGMKDDEITPDQSLLLRQMVSAFTYGFIILPFIKDGYSLAYEAVISKELLFILFIAFAGSVSYLCYYKAIDAIGPTRAMGLNISYSAWAIILGFFIVGSPMTFKMLFFSIMIIIGSVMTVADPEEFSFKKLLSKKTI